MSGRTYRYYDSAQGEVLYPFGYGLSYTSFSYENLTVSPEQMHNPEVLWVSCDVKNTGEVAGDEVVQVYLRIEDASVPVPHHSLVGFKRVHLAPGAVEHIRFEIQPKQYAVVYEDDDRDMTSDHDSLVEKEAEWVVEPGSFTIFVGGGQPGEATGLTSTVAYTGQTVNLAL